MNSFLPPERVLTPLVLQAQNGTNYTKVIHTLLKMTNPYFVHAAKNMKYRFNGSCPFAGVDDIVEKAREVLVERIIPDWSIKKGSFTNYLTKTIHWEMFTILNKESKKSKLMRPLQSVNFEGKDDPINDDEGSSHRSKKKGWLPSQPTDGGFLLAELKYMLKKSVEPKNPIGAAVIWYELQHGKTPVREHKKRFDVPNSTIARKRKEAVAILERII